MKTTEHYVIHFLQKFDAYPFVVRMQGRDYLIGNGNPGFRVIIHDDISKKGLLASTSLALGEAYMHGNIEIEGDLYQALNQILGQIGKFSKNVFAMRKLLMTSASRSNQKKEVTFHYDIGNQFYKMWLDETLSYSCGYFLSEQDTLFQAQQNKIDYILKKLYLREGMTLLDIGCGWGSLLIEAVKKYKVQGVGITLSLEQYKAFRARCKKENLEDKITVKLMDYRELADSGMQFDRVVSVGMLEHVGRKHYEMFMQNVDSVLKPKGICLLHFISALRESPGDPWIKKYIFPGGVIPSLREILAICGEMGFYTLNVESLRRHYNRTLLCWAGNFHKQQEKVKEMFDGEFVRMWDLYLCSCAAAFHNGIIDLHQLLLSKGVNNNLPMTKWF